jgi:hypothetical protein
MKYIVTESAKSKANRKQFLVKYHIEKRSEGMACCSRLKDEYPTNCNLHPGHLPPIGGCKTGIWRDYDGDYACVTFQPYQKAVTDDYAERIREWCEDQDLVLTRDDELSFSIPGTTALFIISAYQLV